MLAYKAEEHQHKSFLLLIVVCIKIIVSLVVTITTKQLFIMSNSEKSTKFWDLVDQLLATDFQHEYAAIQEAKSILGYMPSYSR